MGLRSTPPPLPDPAGFPELLTLTDVATIYGVQPGTVLTAVQRGAFRPLPIRFTHPPCWRRRDVLGTPASDFSGLPLLLTLDEVAVLYGVSPLTIRRALSMQTFSPPPFEKYPYRWRRADVHRDLHRPGRHTRKPVVRDGALAKALERVGFLSGEIALVRVLASAHRPAPVTDLARLPDVLTMNHISAIYRVSPLTIRRAVSTDTVRPYPFGRSPSRWRLADVMRDLDMRRVTLRSRAHGFAMTKLRRQVADDVEHAGLE